MNPGLGACHLGEVGLILRIGPFTAVVAIAGNSIDPFTGQELDHFHRHIRGCVHSTYAEGMGGWVGRLRTQ